MTTRGPRARSHRARAARHVVGVVSALAACALALLPRIARACPSCAALDAGTTEGPSARWLVLAALVSLPFACAAFALLALRRHLGTPKAPR